MNSAQDYLKYAAECVRLAQQASNPADKARLIQMAQAWQELADKRAQGTAARARRQENDDVTKPEGGG